MGMRKTRNHCGYGVSSCHLLPKKMQRLQGRTQNQIEAQRKRVRFGKEEQQNERALTFKKSRSKRYDACSDVEVTPGFEFVRVVFCPF